MHIQIASLALVAAASLQIISFAAAAPKAIPAAMAMAQFDDPCALCPFLPEACDDC